MVTSTSHSSPTKSENRHGWSQLTVSTLCAHTGKHCPAGLHLAKQLHAALAAAGNTLGDDFEISGHGFADCPVPNTCPGSCRFVWQGAVQSVHVFCNVDPDYKLDELLAAARTAAQGPTSYSAKVKDTIPATCTPSASAMLVIEKVPHPLS